MISIRLPWAALALAGDLAAVGGGGLCPPERVRHTPLAFSQDIIENGDAASTDSLLRKGSSSDLTGGVRAVWDPRPGWDSREASFSA